MITTHGRTAARWFAIGPHVFCGLVGAIIGLGACGGPSAEQACGDFYDAYFTEGFCAGGGLVIANASARARFVAACVQRTTLEGTSYTPSYIETCATGLPRVGCNPIEIHAPPCATLPGSLSVGSTCEDDAQCASTSCECGACVATVALGGDCSSLASMCIAGMSCFQGTCIAIERATSGEACNESDTFCENGLVCNGTCAPPAQLGETCFRYSDCDVGLHCEGGGSPATPGVCASGLPAWANPGDPCSDTSPCLVGGCQGGTCPIPLADGAACSGSSPPCDVFSACVNGTCQIEPSTCP